jgi:hypothetical protein
MEGEAALSRKQKAKFVFFCLPTVLSAVALAKVEAKPAYTSPRLIDTY